MGREIGNEGEDFEIMQEVYYNLVIFFIPG